MNLNLNNIQSQIREFYNEILEREPDSGGLQHFTNLVINGTMTLEDVKQALLNSPEGETTNPHYKYLKNIPPERPRGFFDDYQEFFNTSSTATDPNRLNMRYLANIASNKKIISESRILDIASHDGRWSFAALKNGAKHVLGIEGRSYLVQNAVNTMKKYNVREEQYQFIAGDIHDEIKKISTGTIDVIFCFGFFYHTANHYFLLSEMKRLNPKYLILDTFINLSNEPIIRLSLDKNSSEENAIKNSQNNDQETLVGVPSKSALEMLLQSFGFDYNYYDWHAQNIFNWKYIGDYYLKKRLTLIAKNLSYVN